jgi:hypothetical protein
MYSRFKTGLLMENFSHNASEKHPTTMKVARNVKFLDINGKNINNSREMVA